MAEPLKNAYNAVYIEQLAQAITKVHPVFDQHRFAAMVIDETWDARELKDRMHHISTCLRTCLPADYREALEILTQAAPGFGGFEGMFFPDFVATYGQDDWDASLPALRHLTCFSSSEFAVRPFIAADPTRMMTQMMVWAEDTNYHVRRLATEGCRPRLPWAMALPQFKADPSPILPILETLKADPEAYVRRSVANNLNDIAKDHPSLVLAIAERWIGDNPETDWVVKHGCRTLLKAGNPRAMRLFGFADPTQVTIAHLAPTNRSVAIGKTLQFTFQLDLAGDQLCRLRLEYAIDYLKANGKHNSKVFKISEKEFAPGSVHISRNHSFQERTTRKHYPGEHHLTVIINGVAKARMSFLVDAAT